jgi:hypothetical protein
MLLRTLSTLIVILSLQCPALCQTDANVDLVRRYLVARNAIMQLDATPQNIEKALEFCSDDIVYEHPAAKAKIEGKQKMRAGMASYLGLTKDAKYGAKIDAGNRDVVIATVSRTFLSRQDDGSWKPGDRTNITIFEIEKEKIRRILDY